eukprot:Tbor_TRINITY_DN8784_c0_g1::TRINITY_DN8784_c0_g1_i1::g.5804::m.5804
MPTIGWEHLLIDAPVSRCIQEIEGIRPFCRNLAALSIVSNCLCNDPQILGITIAEGYVANVDLIFLKYEIEGILMIWLSREILEMFLCNISMREDSEELSEEAEFDDDDSK